MLANPPVLALDRARRVWLLRLDFQRTARPAADTPNLSHPLPTLHRLLAATRDNLDNSASRGIPGASNSCLKSSQDQTRIHSLSRRRRSPPASSINLGDFPDSPLNDGDLVAHVRVLCGATMCVSFHRTRLTRSRR